jgi:polar amino acid transport system substrate-binding protein
MSFQKKVIIGVFCTFFISNYLIFTQSKISILTEELPPLNFTQDGIVVGSATNIVRMILEHANLDYEITVFPWARSYTLALRYENTLIYSINRTASREEEFQWIGMVSQRKADAYLYSLKSADIIKEKNDIFKKYRIAVINKDVNYEFLLQEEYSNIYVADSFESCIRMLFAQRVDMIVATDEMIQIELEKQGKPVEMIEQVIILRYSDPYLAASRITSTEVVDTLRRSYEELVKTGQIPNFRE